MKKTLEMTFRNATGKEVTISVANPKDALTATDVNTAMNTILAKNIFVTSGGDLTQIVGAQLRVVDVTALA